MVLTTNILLYLSTEKSSATPIEKPMVQKIRHIGLPTRGKYSVREETEKAPTYEHPCNLTWTAVKISFPEEMRSEIFVNLLGYKEPNLVHLRRCRGRCAHNDSPLTCRATRVKEKKVKMMIRSFLTGKEPVDKMKELILDEHEECGCQCSQELAKECSGRFNDVTCECECPALEFGERQAHCELRRDTFWDSKSCQCRSKTIAARGVDIGDPVCDQIAQHHLELINTLDSSESRTVDMLAWVILGSSLTMVMALSISTYHYRNRVKQAERKLKTGKEEGEGDREEPKAEEYTVLRRVLYQTDDILLDRQEDRLGTACEQYNEHGVQIENNCWD